LSQEKYLKINTRSSRVTFSATDKRSAGEFVLFFHQQSKQSGFLMDISSLEGSFLCMEGNFILANSSKAPIEKFLIIPVDE
jgi:hypothetical protein